MLISVPKAQDVVIKLVCLQLKLLDRKRENTSEKLESDMFFPLALKIITFGIMLFVAPFKTQKLCPIFIKVNV